MELWWEKQNLLVVVFEFKEEGQNEYRRKFLTVPKRNKTLQIEKGWFTTDDNLLPQTLGHIQHEYEALSEIHTLAHHHCWCLLHTELARLAFSEWRFIFINGGKNLRTTWTELGDEFPEIFNLCAEQNLENVAMDQQMNLNTPYLWVFGLERIEGV